MIAQALLFALLAQQPPPEVPNELPPLPPPPPPSAAPPPQVQPPAPPAPAVGIAVELKRKLLFVQAERNSYKLIQDTRTIEVGMFGGDAIELFSEVPEAKDEIGSFRTKRIVGFVLNMVSLGLILIDAAYLALAVLNAPSGATSQVLSAGLIVYVVLAVPAVVLSLVGGILQQSAISNFFNAVNRYNAALINKHLPDDAKVNLQLFSMMPAPVVFPLAWKI